MLGFVISRPQKRCSYHGEVGVLGVDLDSQTLLGAGSCREAAVLKDAPWCMDKKLTCISVHKTKEILQFTMHLTFLKY